VSFEIGNDCVGILSTNASLENAEPSVMLHFDLVTAGRPFTKRGFVAVTELLLGKAWNIAFSPWKVSAGLRPLNQARQALVDVYKIWKTTGKTNSENGHSTGEEFNASASQVVQ
jgi:hypothetical protein